VASTDNRGWSLYWAPRLQPVATGRKITPENRCIKGKPLPGVATGCREDPMVKEEVAAGDCRATAARINEPRDSTVRCADRREDGVPDGVVCTDSSTTDRLARPGERTGKRQQKSLQIAGF
jgi:hypothetical protein